MGRGRKKSKANINRPDEHVRSKKKERTSTTGHDDGESALNPTTGSSSIQVTSGSSSFCEPLTNVTSNHPTLDPSDHMLSAASSGNGASNPTPHTGYFGGAHHFTINNPTMMTEDNANERKSMKLLASNIIVGAEFDSSDHRPSCHPETRLDICHEIRSWMNDLLRKYKILWLNGPAGVGKSAILQTIAETESESGRSILGATLFFSRPNNRDDPKCVFITIAHRLAVRYPPYRQYVTRLLTLDRTLVSKSLADQFKTFIVRPFAEEKLDGLHDTILILLDGLDECNGEDAQREIILLIAKFVLQYPTSPLIWLIASRPEPHIRGTFSKAVQFSHKEIKVPVDSDQGCRDVERYLQDSFADIRGNFSESIPLCLQQWPSESDLSTIATKSSGLFIFPSTVIRFIGDEDYADPISQLKTVLEVTQPTSSSAGGPNPFAALDALYTRILSGVPRDVLSTTVRLLSMHSSENQIRFRTFMNFRGFATICNWLGVSQGRAYSALRRLHSVLKIPEPQKATTQDLSAFHASFFDYLASSSRSGTFYVFSPEIIQHHLLRCIHVLLESHGAGQTSDVNVNRISLSWPIEIEEHRLRTQHGVFHASLRDIMDIRNEFVDDTLRNEFSKLSAFFEDHDFGEVLEFRAGWHMLVYPKLAFAMSLEHWGVLKTVPLQSLDYDAIRLDHEPAIYQKPGDLSSEDPTLKADLKKNLATWTEMAPSHPVTMLGRGRKSCAFFEFHIPGEAFWTLALPCVQSS
ncbi:hypothetical protein P691DRAFT_805097 [Macrolepiota fuliginosa MF-IS2]|uniref:NACHT domain-containing protein n=1 Tax=Macrolepiota fuliginosa MF-IS2 TaxID=1400762 RepID=A0A9P6BZ39_9AGAR|nr:hypothetical protein P691DRAFT_805097 [Macrolepiota fuliginosa MF-IS2]